MEKDMKIKKVGKNKYRRKKGIDVDDFLTALVAVFIVFVLVFSIILNRIGV